MFNYVLLLPVGTEWIVLLVVAAVFLFGAKKIPEIARSLGRARGEFEKGKRESEDELRRWREDREKKDQTERERLEQTAKSLGIPAEGKSDEELREALRKAL